MFRSSMTSVESKKLYEYVADVTETCVDHATSRFTYAVRAHLILRYAQNARHTKSVAKE